MEHWFAVRTHPRREIQVEVVLRRRGIETYLPQVPARRRPPHRSPVAEPLFPNYIFSRLELGSTKWIEARSAPGVAYFLGAGGVPCPLPDDLLEQIRRRVEGVWREGWLSPFKKGDRVIIESGPFRGLEAVFDGTLSANGRVRVFLELVRRLVPVDLDVSLLRRASFRS